MTADHELLPPIIGQKGRSYFKFSMCFCVVLQAYPRNLFSKQSENEMNCVTVLTAFGN